MLHSDKIAQQLQEIDAVIRRGKFKDSWESLMHHKTPDWYYNGKFGIFIHWGIYSVPAYGNEWYARNMYLPSHREFEHHRRTYGDHRQFGYKDFIPMFRAEKFDSAAWIDLFERAGAKFILPVAEHHDGFAMYDTAYNRWNAKEMGPCRDVLGELKAECEKRDLTFCASTHRAEHYFFMNGGRTFESDVNDERYEDFYGPAVYCEKWNDENMTKTCDTVDEISPTEEYLQDWLCRTCEIIDKYQPKLLYFDWWIQNKAFKPYLKKLAAYYYNRAEEWGEEVTIDYKHNAFAWTCATYDVERGALGDISPIPWQTDTAIGKESWGYRADNSYKTTYEVVTTLIDVVSKNGMLLLNVGPKADGTITDEETAVLLETGQWLKVNGEGIYDTTYYRFYKEGSNQTKSGMFSEGAVAYTSEDFRFTYKNAAVYAFQMKPSDGKDVLIKSFHTTDCGHLIRRVTSLGENIVDSFACDGEGLHIRLKSVLETSLPVCFKLELE